MSDVSGKLSLFITANAGSFNKALDDASKKFEKFSKNFTDVGKTLSVGLTVPLTAFATKAVSEFQDTAKAIGQIEAGLRSTGNAAGFTAEQLGAMAKSLQGASIFSDDQILNDVTAQLLTFTNVSGNAFERAQQAAVDLSSRLGQDLQSSAIQLGKALNDPVKGLTALGRVGVQFTEQQKSLIEGFVATGDIASAQKVILDELNVEFGGSAQAALDASGGLIALRNAFNDVAETVGGIIAPVLSSIAETLRGVAEGFQNLDPAAQKVIVALAAVAAAIGPLSVAIGYMSGTVIPNSIKGFEAMKKGLQLLSLPTSTVAVAIAAVTAAVTLGVAAYNAYTNSANPAAAAAAKVAEVQELAADSIADERAELNTLIKIAKDETLSKQTRETAIKKLNAISPQYLGNLSLETINTEEATKATNEYAAALLRRARAQIAQEKIVEIEREIFEREKEIVEQRKDLADVSIWESIGDAITQSQLSSASSIISNQESIQKLRAEQEALTKVLVENQDVTTASNTVVDASTTSYERLKTTLEDVKEAARIDLSSIGAVSSTGTSALGIDQLTGSTPAGLAPTSAPVLDPNQFQQSEEATKKLQLANEELEASYVKLGETIGATFQQSGETLQDYFRNVVKAVANAIRQVIRAFVAQAVAGYISKVVSTLGPVGLALAAAAPGVVGGLFDALVPAFAKGGMVTGPQLALVGDNPSGKEAIIPFEKMGSFLSQFGGAGRQVIVLDTVLKGNEMLLVQRNAQNNNIRQYGRTL